MATYATWLDVTTSYELVIPEEHRPRVEALLRQASARLTALVPSLPARLEAGEVDPDLPTGLVVEAVLRVYRNPAGVTQQSTGPWSNSFNSNASRNEIFFDPAQIAALLPSPDEMSPGVGTIKVAVNHPVSPVGALDADGRYTYTPENWRGPW